MMKQKITEIKETYTVKSRIRGSHATAGGSQFEEKTLTRYKEVVTVEGWARFGHYLLDVLVYYACTFIIGIFLAIILILFRVDMSFLGGGHAAAGAIDRLVSLLILYPGYYILFESTMQSSPGKLILGRVVVNEYGEKPSFKQILGRSYSRLVPFESFSCFEGLGWHDSWSGTMVIRKKDLEELKLAIKVQAFGNDINA